MLYSLNKSKQFYNYTPSKNIFNDNIVKGKWFKIPPGWSLIEVAPVCDENDWGGKTWNDARAFNWGYGGDSEYEQQPIQKLFNDLYYIAAEEYLRLYGILKMDRPSKKKSLNQIQIMILLMIKLDYNMNGLILKLDLEVGI